MTKSQHTPAPWKISLAAINTNTIEIVADGKRIAELNAMWVKLNNDELFANANLIIAGPKMLEALKAIKSASLRVNDFHRATGYQDALPLIDAAISEAEKNSQHFNPILERNVLCLKLSKNPVSHRFLK